MNIATKKIRHIKKILKIFSANTKAFFFPDFSISFEIMVLSAHRNPLEVHNFCLSAEENGYRILVGAAGMAAHLAGALKANSILPVIGVPLDGGVLTGLDSLLATLQMPKGVPVATMSIGKSGFINAAILSAEIIACNLLLKIILLHCPIAWE